MWQFRNEKCDSRHIVRKMQLRFHFKTLPDLLVKNLANIFRIKLEIFQVPLYTHKKTLRASIHMLAKLQNVAAIAKNKLGNRVNNATLVLAVN